ncbi:MAG TPA: hypothetical protein VFH77_16415 [Streptomyces sp.]|nr:hypothetical protein [Streptomyces sp.]
MICSSFDDGPVVGDVVVDESDARVGEVRGLDGGFVRLRPLGGGPAWHADPVRLRRATPAERLHAQVSAVNAHSRRRAPKPGG